MRSWRNSHKISYEIISIILVMLFLMIVTVEEACASDENGLATSLSDFSGHPMSIIEGAIFDEYLVKSESFTDHEELHYYNNEIDAVSALRNGAVDAYINSYSTMYMYTQECEDVMIFPEVIDTMDYAFGFTKGNPLRDEFNAAMEKFISSGEADALYEKWFGESASEAVPIEQDWVGEKGTLSFWLNVGTPPMAYVNDKGEVVGYSTDYVLSVVRLMGYNLEIKECAFGGLIPALEAGYADIAGRTMTITEERSKVIDFSDPFMSNDLMLLVRKTSVSPKIINGDTAALSSDSRDGISSDTTDPTENSDKNENLFRDIINKFTRTFIIEGRWKIFAKGMGNTLLITLVSGLGGTLLGILYYMLLNKRYRVVGPVLTTINSWITGTPVVVFLMVLYYIVFAGTPLDDIWVAIVCFGIIFTIAVAGLLENGVRALGNTQLEGSLALGFTDSQAFFKVILPQAIYQVLPLYRARFIEHLKGTAIVGYIAIQDLTKMSDLVRSRTFDAFFPLISTAIIYLLLGFSINKAFIILEKKMDPERRVGHMLKGVRTK